VFAAMKLKQGNVSGKRILGNIKLLPRHDVPNTSKRHSCHCEAAICQWNAISIYFNLKPQKTL